MCSLGKGILQNLAGWERLRFTGVVELWCYWTLGRRFGLQRRLRWRAATSTAHRNTERAQACAGQHVVWQMWADGSKLPQPAPRVLRAFPGKLFRWSAWRCAGQWHCCLQLLILVLLAELCFLRGSDILWR